jgi:hypothetical protein
MGRAEFEFLDVFERAAQEFLVHHSEVGGSWSLSRKGRHTELNITSSSASGFDVGAVCEVYGLYPSAGQWRGAPWEPVSDSIEGLCDAYFGFVRALLSPDARLQLTFRREHLQAAIVELRTSDGWRLFERERQVVLPFGTQRVVLLQNNQLPSRFPFAGLQLSGWGVYPWERGA